MCGMACLKIQLCNPHIVAHNRCPGYICWFYFTLTAQDTLCPLNCCWDYNSHSALGARGLKGWKFGLQNSQGLPEGKQEALRFS